MKNRAGKSDMNNDINKKMKLVKGILDDVYELLYLFNPIVDKIKISKDFQHFFHDGTIEKMAAIFGKISENSKEIAKYPLSEDFLRNIKN